MTNNDIIKSVSDDQQIIISDILSLHNNGDGFDVDITYSTGNFYGYKMVGRDIVIIPQPKHKFDVAPMDNTVTKIEPWGDIPIEDGAVHSVMFDPPFIISPRNAPSVLSEDDNNKIFRRFSGYYPVNELLDSYHHWLKESYRILEDGGICVVKCQPTVTGGKELNSHMFVWFIAECLGFDVIDEFILIADNRLIGRMENQEHARKYHSYFFVLKKKCSKKVPYLNYLTDDEIADIMSNFVANNVGKNNGDKKYRDDCVPQLDSMNRNDGFVEVALF